MKNSKLSMKVYPKTVYTDVVGMPDPMLLGVTIHYYNHSAINLYIKIFGTGPSPWSSNSVELGLLNSGASNYRNLDNFLSRTLPTSETTEQITLTLKGYSDSGYSDLVYTFARNVTVVFLKSDDGSWTLDEDDDFDDGTVMGWDVRKILGAQSPTLAVVNDYVLSVPYSIKMTHKGETNNAYNEGELYKEFTTPNKNTVYAIFNVRTDRYLTIIYQYWLRIIQGSSILLQIGGGGPSFPYYPNKKWMRIVVPLTPNVTEELKIRHRAYMHGAIADYVYIWLEDFKIISKD